MSLNDGSICATQQNYYLSFREVALQQPHSEGTTSLVKNACQGYSDGVLYHQLLVCREGNFGMQLKQHLRDQLDRMFMLSPLLCAPRYRIPAQYLFQSWIAIPPLPSSCVVTPGRTTQLHCSGGTLKEVLLCKQGMFPAHSYEILV